MRAAHALSGVAILLALGLPAVGEAKLPQLTPEQKTKAEEVKAKAADAAKHQAELLGKAQDRAAENYKKGKGKAVASAATPAAPPKKK